jgi:hypothetical protein
VLLAVHVALVSLTDAIRPRELQQAGAAVQKQLVRDFLPVWGLRATLDTFADLASVPNDYLQVLMFSDPEELRSLDQKVGPEHAARLIDSFERGMLTGLHLNGFTREPFALVRATDAWTVVLSHEVLEMVADPFGNRLIAAAHPLDRSQRVKYLLEVCDPCQAIWYPVNGVPVSDFYLPRYFDPVAVDRMRYSFTGEIGEPLEILPNGYLTWVDPDDSHLYTFTHGDSAPQLVARLLDLASSTAPLRTVVDTQGSTPQLSWAMLRAAGGALAAGSANAAVVEASQGAADRTAETLASLAIETP